MLAQIEKEEELMKHKSAQEAVADMRLLFTYLDSMQGLDHISFDLSLARGLDYYTGVIYEAILVKEKPTSTPIDDTKSDAPQASSSSTPAQTSMSQLISQSLGSIASGGRYDNLIGMFSGKQVPAVGISIGLERIMGLLETREREKGRKVRTTATDVMVASMGGLLKERMEISAELWRNGIGAEFLYSENPAQRKQIEHIFENGIPFGVWIGQDEITNNMVKVHSPLSLFFTRILHNLSTITMSLHLS